MARFGIAPAVKVLAAKTLVGLGLPGVLGAAPAAQAEVWTTAAWVGGAIVGILLLGFLLSRGIKPSKDDDNLL